MVPKTDDSLEALVCTLLEILSASLQCSLRRVRNSCRFTTISEIIVFATDFIYTPSCFRVCHWGHRLVQFQVYEKKFKGGICPLRFLLSHMKGSYCTS